MLLELQSVSMRFPVAGGKLRHAVSEVDLTLAPGEALVSMMTSDQGTIVFLLRDGKVKAHAVALSRKALDTVVRELRNGDSFTIDT